MSQRSVVSRSEGDELARSHSAHDVGEDEGPPHPAARPHGLLFPPTLGSLGLAPSSGTYRLGVPLVGAGWGYSVGYGQGRAEIRFREKRRPSILAVPSEPRGAPSPPALGKSPSTCSLQQLEAEVSGRPAGRARIGMRMGAPVQQEAPAR